MLKKYDDVKVTGGKHVGFVGRVTWFGITRRGSFAICIENGAQKMWVNSAADLQNADGTPVVVDEQSAPMARGATDSAAKAMTRKRSVADVRALEARVAALEAQVAALLDAAKAVPVRRRA